MAARLIDIKKRIFTKPPFCDVPVSIEDAGILISEYSERNTALGDLETMWKAFHAGKLTMWNRTIILEIRA